MLTFVNNRIFKHKVMRVNYTTYDLRRAQDSLNSRTHADFMTLACDVHSALTNDDFPYRFGRILGIFHTKVLHTRHDSQSHEPQHVEFLFVRWFKTDHCYHGGWKSKRLHRIAFVDGDNDAAFGFLDPAEVIRGVHLIPAFHHGRTSDLLPPSVTARMGSDDDDDWRFFYVNMFVDRDMMMRFRGGGVGHKSTREVTDMFLGDRDPMDSGFRQRELNEDEAEENLGSIVQDDDDDDSENGEEDYGYMIGDSDAETEWEEVDDDANHSKSQGFDSLGAEDGLDVPDPTEELGFAAL